MNLIPSVALANRFAGAVDCARTDNQRRNWVKMANDYLACLKKYALDQQAIAKPLIDQAKPYADAANAAIEEHNKSVTFFKEEQDKND